MSVERGCVFSRGIIFPLERITFFYPAFVCTHKKTKGKVIDLFSLFVVQKKKSQMCIKNVFCGIKESNILTFIFCTLFWERVLVLFLLPLLLSLR